MKRPGTALLAVLVLTAALCAGAAGAAPEPLTVKTFDPFWPLAKPRYEAPEPVGTVVEGCALRPGTNCAGAKFQFKQLPKLPGADLSLANLRGASLRLWLNGASLAGADLRGANLNGTEATALTAPFAEFDGADLGGFDAVLGRFAGAHFAKAAEMYESSFFAADLAGADLRGTLLGSELAGAVLSGADLRGVNLRGAQLQFADLSQAKVSPGQLKGADLCDTVLPSGKVANRRKRCELPALYIGIDERQPTIRPTDARYSLLLHAAGTWRGQHREECGEICPEGGQWLTHLRGHSYAYAHLPGTHRFAGRTQALVNLTGADLADADLARAVIPGVAASFSDLAGADLEGADVTYSELAAAHLVGANLTALDGRDADLTRADLAGANLSGARLGAASLVEADLRGVDVEGTDLSGADLYRAKVDPTFPAGAVLCDTVMPDGTIASPATDCEHR